ncbi:hypothetical protein N7468_002321 [Penicillium chermesinum]|uniref:Uncharacterized protein n=1 Tax=Penicillium chermesinum TaxID=63820 RepID=A0A9W9PIB0_9EURO|nr:uncharacterized protein N7468_002321 [Penicillium chermesinum]KAJ5247338.1 hypothetical protein N7468_002321 [Penicillium chermesinum]KAJ6145581.1 hypothetical protein N7470_009476 [Penicillium chermesinum]
MSFALPGEEPDLELEASRVEIASPPPFSVNRNVHNDLLLSHLEKRYTTVSIPSTYGRLYSSPAPGTVAGIVIGSVGGVVLLFYLTFLALNPGGLARGSSSEIDEEVVVRSRPGSRRHEDMIEVVEERDRRRDSYRRRPSPRDQIIVEESMTGSHTTDSRRNDFVEVIEEESSAISSASPRPPRRRSRSRRSGVRSVNPHDHGGGSDFSEY